jgi:hypothetical protein
MGGKRISMLISDNGKNLIGQEKGLSSEKVFVEESLRDTKSDLASSHTNYSQGEKEYQPKFAINGFFS